MHSRARTHSGSAPKVWARPLPSVLLHPEMGGGPVCTCLRLSPQVSLHMTPKVI